MNIVKPTGRRLETSLYAAVKRHLESLGYEAKGEICGCDVVGIRPGEPPVVVITELKLALSLELILQGVDRLAAADEVWLAVLATRRGKPSRYWSSRRPTGHGRMQSVAAGWCRNTGAGRVTQFRAAQRVRQFSRLTDKRLWPAPRPWPQGRSAPRPCARSHTTPLP